MWAYFFAFRPRKVDLESRRKCGSRPFKTLSCSQVAFSMAVGTTVFSHAANEH